MYLILPYFILLIVVLQIFLRKNSKKDEERTQQFWERERKANEVRKKDISNLNYITIPSNLLPDRQLTDHSLEKQNDSFVDKCLCLSNVKKAYDAFANYYDKKMLNLNNISNTDIKMTYGAANLTILSEYDDNFTAMCKAAVKLAKTLDENDLLDEAVPYLEFIVKSGTDMTSAYMMLADYYIKNNNLKEIENLKSYANLLNSLTKDIILKKLLALPVSYTTTKQNNF